MTHVAPVVVYGALWCAQSNRTRGHLARMGVSYEFIDEDDQAAELVEAWNGGERRIPSVVLSAGGDEVVLSVPSDEELDRELASRGLLPLAGAIAAAAPELP
ncbi:MAG: NrdH-redoxin [Acidobacteriota bacterium]|nr:NrdH-redoxin [Acidobacteriota bacterium]